MQTLEPLTIEGIYTLRAITLDDQLEHEINRAIEKQDRERFERLIKAATIREKVIKNIVTIGARSMIAGRIAGDDTTYSGTINYLALGDDNTAVSENDTALGNEVYRKTKNIYSHTNNVVNLDWYFTKANTNGTYEEIGTFVDGTASADSGLLFSRILTGGWPKTSNEGMAVSVQYTIINS